MLIGVAIEFAVGLLCAGMGLLLWKRQMLSLLHDYHYANVRKEDIPAYARQMGIGLIQIGVGICAAGLLNLIRSPLWWIPLTAGFLLGIATLARAQKRYNGSWF